MKKIVFISLILLIIFVVACCPKANAQTNINDKVIINTTDLTPDQLAKIQAQKQLDEANAKIENLQNKINTYGKWVGVGGEVGTAVKEGLTAVVDVANKFGKTDVGKFTLVMIAWKVMGQDIIKILLGILFFSVLIFIILKFYRNLCVPKKILIENPGLFRYPKKYQVIKSVLDDEEDTVWMTIILIILFLIGIWITYSIMF